MRLMLVALALLEPFEQAFNCKVNVKEYEGTDTAIALLEQSSMMTSSSLTT